jgi:hypothetical protein
MLVVCFAVVVVVAANLTKSSYSEVLGVRPGNKIIQPTHVVWRVKAIRLLEKGLLVTHDYIPSNSACLCSTPGHSAKIKDMVLFHWLRSRKFSRQRTCRCY